jgi:KaiC/GvpD/RAD55 family RecA-like ATPase
MGLHFIFSGAASGQPGVIASLQENPIQLQKVARGFGWSLDNERVAVMYRSPTTSTSTNGSTSCSTSIETTGATRVMIDSLSDLQYATPDPIRFREFIYSLTQRLSRAGISPIMTSEIPDLFHVGRLAEYGISHLSDNVILLQYLRAESRLLRTVTILKSRASAHDPEIREFEITPTDHPRDLRRHLKPTSICSRRSDGATPDPLQARAVGRARGPGERAGPQAPGQHDVDSPRYMSRRGVRKTPRQAGDQSAK